MPNIVIKGQSKTKALPRPDEITAKNKLEVKAWLDSLSGKDLDIVRKESATIYLECKVKKDYFEKRQEPHKVVLNLILKVKDMVAIDGLGIVRMMSGRSGWAYTDVAKAEIAALEQKLKDRGEIVPCAGDPYVQGETGNVQS